MSYKSFIPRAMNQDLREFMCVCYAGNETILVSGREGNRSRVFRSTNNGSGEWGLVASGTGGFPYIVGPTSDGSGVAYYYNRDDDKIKKSVDYGATWDAGVASGGDGKTCSALACHGNYVWASVWNNSTGARNIISTNGGVSYGVIPSGDIPYQVFKFVYLGGGVLLAAVSAGKIYKSTNYGASGSWSLVYTFASSGFSDLCVISANVWLAVVGATSVKVYRTVNGGASFDGGTTIIETGSQKKYPQKLVYDPVSDVVYMGTSGLYEYQYTPPEWSWNLTAPASIYQSVNQGISWELAQDLKIFAYIYDTALDGNGLPLFAGAGDYPISASEAWLIGKNTSSSALSITQAGFIASNGQLDSSSLLIHKTDSNETYQHPTGQTIFVTNYGFRYNLGNISHNIFCSLSNLATFNKMWAPT